MILKSFVINDNLRNGVVTIQNQEFNFNQESLICIKSIIFTNVPQVNLNTSFVVTTNLIVDKVLKNNKKHEYNPPLALSLLRQSNFEIQFDLIWHQVNNDSKPASIIFLTSDMENFLQINANVSIHVLVKV